MELQNGFDTSPKAKLAGWLAVLVTSVSICDGTSVMPYWAQMLVVDRIAAAASSGSERVAATELLKAIVEGRSLNAAELSRFGAKREDISSPAFRESDVREHAVLKMGEVGSDQVLGYLQGLELTGVPEDEGRRVLGVVQIVQRRIVLGRMRSAPEQVVFLEQMLGQWDGKIVSGTVSAWAIEELCNRGSLSSLAFIETKIKVFDNSKRGERRIRFCESRMRVIGGHPNRVQALESAVKIPPKNQGDIELNEWAEREMQKIDSAESDAALDRLAAELLSVPSDSLEALRLQDRGRRLLDRGRKLRAR
jgi:hypothetical protein